MTDLIQPPPKRDSYGRYRLPDPDDDGAGKELSWTRATTFCKTVADTYGLNQWANRMTVKGLTMRPDLFAQAAAASLEDKKDLDDVVKSAQEAAGASSGRNMGTALHQFTERVDRGETLLIPPPLDADVAAYQQALADAGVTVLPEFIERIVVVKKFSVAGTFDRVIRWSALPDGRLMVADLKTGKDLRYSWAEIAIQLALYANADGIWDGNTQQYEPMPDIDKDRALVFHLPAGSGKCDVYEVDIAAGWEAANLCAEVRAWRTRKQLAQRIAGGQAAVPIGPSVLEQLGSASSIDELNSIYTSAYRRGVWNAEMTNAASARKKQLSAQIAS